MEIASAPKKVNFEEFKQEVKKSTMDCTERDANIIGTQRGEMANLLEARQPHGKTTGSSYYKNLQELSAKRFE